MYKYQVKLMLTDGSIIEGVCIDTLYNELKQECLKVVVKNQELDIELETILKMQPMTTNPHFDLVEFNS